MAGRRSFRERKNKKESWIYIILALLLVFVMAKWGIAAFINLLAGPINTKSSKQSQIEDKIPPQAPVLSGLPEATNSAKIKVDGFTEADVSVIIFDNDLMIGTAQVDKDGAFYLEMTLKDGENEIIAKAKDGADNESQSAPKTVTLDSKAPEIKVDSPKDGAEFFGSKNQTTSISGKVSEVGSLSLNNTFVRINSDGSFATSFKLSGGDNTLTLIATDVAGNTSGITLKLKLTL